MMEPLATYNVRAEGTRVRPNDRDRFMHLNLGPHGKSMIVLQDLDALVRLAAYEIGVQNQRQETMLLDAMKYVMMPDGHASRIFPSALPEMRDTDEVMAEDLLALAAWVEVAIDRFNNGHLRLPEAVATMLKNIVMHHEDEIDGVWYDGYYERYREGNIRSRAERAVEADYGAYVKVVDLACMIGNFALESDGEMFYAYARDDAAQWNRWHRSGVGGNPPFYVEEDARVLHHNIGQWMGAQMDVPRMRAEVRASFVQYNQGPSPIPRRYILYPGNPPPERMLRGPLRVVPGGTWHVDPSELANREGGRAILKKINSHSRALKPENRASLVAQHDLIHNALDQ